ncbi:hypothetical protein Dhaf_1436 [Desulfitobacterium hafniense DCB-2]|uniref:Uncharacterized protein n=1 Tax=Desulfitobacterium hafniense (strain DSM 10664 / DCB-2) TaxID=272564 RepID=B8FNW5_DESHD|nr:hypothetical protein [Desulfitobacterium hafniense]ACL19490.1 hypothetical protein Dhaf_1436 [Desulfitobacterium hafniense DCB-2]
MKKRGILLLILISTVLLGGIAGKLLWKPDPIELLTHGLEELTQATSFRYTMIQHQTVEGKDRILNQILGEKDGGNTRISGEVVGTKTEMILTSEGLYMQDPFTKRWIRYPSVPAAHEAFLAELNPLSSLQFKEYGEVVLQGQEKLDKVNTWVLKFNPTIQNQIMENGWTDFAYIMFIGKRDKLIHRVIIEAKSKTDGQMMSLMMEFKDYGETMNISVPINN